MAVELTQEVSSRLESDHFGRLTTVARSGQPVHSDGNGAGIIVVGIIVVGIDKVWTTPTEA